MTPDARAADPRLEPTEEHLRWLGLEPDDHLRIGSLRTLLRMAYLAGLADGSRGTVTALQNVMRTSA